MIDSGSRAGVSQSVARVSETGDNPMIGPCIICAATAATAVEKKGKGTTAAF